MIQHSFSKINLKKTLLILFSVLIVLCISLLITTEVKKSQPDNLQQSVDDRFNKIKVQLEFKGLTQTVKEMTGDYTKLFDGFSNVIITDDSGKILYNVNDGYISEKNKFLVLIDPWQANGYGSNIAYLIDSKNTIKYSTQLDILLNMNKLKEQSAKNPLSKVLFLETQESDDYLGDKEITNSEGSTYVISSETKIIMNYSYIASKGLNLYSLYDSEHQYNNYYIFTNYLNAIRHTLMIFIFVFLILFWILLPLWVFKDARKQYLNASKWTIITLLTSILGFDLYMIFRPKNVKCIFCNRVIETNWIMCPYCGKKINTSKTIEHK